MNTNGRTATEKAMRLQPHASAQRLNVVNRAAHTRIFPLKQAFPTWGTDFWECICGGYCSLMHPAQVNRYETAGLCVLYENGLEIEVRKRDNIL